jgi:hypothetical protein
MTTVAKPRVANTRLTPAATAVAEQLGLLADLAGTWQGTGFNLIARPDFHDNANLYLQLNQTSETLTIEPIGSPVPNRGFGQDDISLFGLNYLDKIADAATGGALHFEPGLWMTQPPTSYPEESAQPADQIIFRLASIPHGNAILAEGTARAFNGPPVVASGAVPYAFSTFPSFNSTPFAAGGPINAAGSSEAVTGPLAAPGAVGFTQYNVADPASLANPRTPFDTDPADPPLPASINGVPMQTAVNDPVTLLQAVVQKQAAAGATFAGVALNIATQPRISFRTEVNDPVGLTTTVNVIDGGGGIENIPFLSGATPTVSGGEGTGAQGPNAQTVLFYATFWISQVTPKRGNPFMQLQYAQFSVLNFPIFAALHAGPGPEPTGPVVNLGWPHVSVATLTKSFG